MTSRAPTRPVGLLRSAPIVCGVAFKEPGTEAVRNFDPAAMIRARRTLGLTHDALAAIVNIGRPNLIAYEKGRRRPTPQRLVSLAAALQVDPLMLTTSTPATATLTDLRIRAGLDMTTISARLDLDRATYQAIELGETRMSHEISASLAELLGISTRQLRLALKRGLASGAND
jgi:transcriptional regulator with XRE-family HTH domain